MVKEVKQLEIGIKSIKIQGATNVALATLRGMKMTAQKENEDTFQKVLEAGKRLSTARENEPLAENAVAYVAMVDEDNTDKVIAACNEYEDMLKTVKEKMIKYGVDVLRKEEGIITHCHSSSAIAIIKRVVRERDVVGQHTYVISTETRPLYQGRKTAEELYNDGVDVTQVVDSAAPAFIVRDKDVPVGAVVVGCDELLKDGAFVNKVGTFSLALAAQADQDEFYVATTLLKLNPRFTGKELKVEEREAKEVWSEAPEGLKIINPAFDLVHPDYVSGYITEAGVLKAQEILPRAKEMYPWMFG